MQCDVTRCIICRISRQGLSNENSRKEVILGFQVTFAMQSTKYLTNFRLISTLILHKHLIGIYLNSELTPTMTLRYILLFVICVFVIP